MNLTPELAEQFDKLTMQLRGYEVARENDDGSWLVVAKYRPNQLGLEEAIKTARWLEWRSNQRKLGFVYKARPIVSIDVGITELRQTGDVESALVQDVGDIIPFQPMALAEGDVEDFKLPAFDHEAAKENAVEKATEEPERMWPDNGERYRGYQSPGTGITVSPQDIAAGGFVVAKDAPVVPLDYQAQAASMPFDLGGES